MPALLHESIQSYGVAVEQTVLGLQPPGECSPPFTSCSLYELMVLLSTPVEAEAGCTVFLPMSVCGWGFGTQADCVEVSGERRLLQTSPAMCVRGFSCITSLRHEFTEELELVETSPLSFSANKPCSQRSRVS
ncbi:uncharacterized [Tachysurus ichikawai]